MNVEGLTDLNAAMVAAGDWSATRTVYGVVIALGVIGVALLVLAIWLIKQTKPEPELLAPLERMDDRAWRKQEPAQMRRDLDSLRPEGARPVAPEKGVPVIDADFAQNRPTLGNFDDLQAQLAADIRRTASGGADPLLAETVSDVASDDDTAEPEAASSTAESGAAVPDAPELPAPAPGSALDHAAGSADDSSDRDGARDVGVSQDSDASEADDTRGADDTGDIEVDECGVRPAPTAGDEHSDTE